MTTRQRRLSDDVKRDLCLKMHLACSAAGGEEDEQPGAAADKEQLTAESGVLSPM